MLKDGVGTAFLIGKDLIMTNHHVLATREIARTGKAVFFRLKDSQDGVMVDLDPEQFFYTSPTRDQLGFKPITKTNLDFTIVSIKPDPKITAISHIAFSIFNSSKPPEGSYANIIHHPKESDNSSYQQASFRDNIVKQVMQFTLHYTTYTDPGSSGAPVIDDAGNLIALHRASCTELLQALLKVLGPLLEELFPKIQFKEQELILKNPQGRNIFGICAPINGSSLYVFSEGELKGMYYHQDVTKTPASLFLLIQDPT